MRVCQLINRVFIHHPLRTASAPLRLCSSSSDQQRPGPGPGPSLLRHLTSKIKATGPITVAEYMKEVLTNPVTGYYVKKNMLGPEGDFITSPEISQIFGELLGIWVVSEFIAAGRPEQLQLVELGPGKGSLAADVLRVLHQLRSVVGGASVSLHLVEVSPVLSRLQAQTLIQDQDPQIQDQDQEEVYLRGSTSSGLPVSWYRSLDHVPAGFSIFFAHEFFDALPIHKFQRTQRGWREVMVDIHLQQSDQLRFVLAPSPTPATMLLQPGEGRSHVEVCVEGGVVIQQLSKRISDDGGAALIIDYGHDGTKEDTFRAFKGHRLHDVLSCPGSADLTADVDFSYLRQVAGEGVACLGPVSQRRFLKNMGIDTRMEVLLRSCSDPSIRNQLISSYRVLMDPDQMGERFHFFSLMHHSRLQKTQETQKNQGLKLEKKQPTPSPVAGFSEISFS